MSYLDSQTQGENPNEFGNDISGILDLEPFYRTNVRYEHLSDATGIAPSGIVPRQNIFLIEVPQNELWFLHASSLWIVNETGFVAAASGYLAVQNELNILGTFFVPLATNFPSRITLQDKQGQIFPNFYSRPWVLRPGERIQALLDTNASTGFFTMVWSMTIQKLSI